MLLPEMVLARREPKAMLGLEERTKVGFALVVVNRRSARNVNQNNLFLVEFIGWQLLSH